MTEKELKASLGLIYSLLSSMKLKSAFDQLKKLIAHSGLGLFFDRIYSLEVTYRYMLKYKVD